MPAPVEPPQSNVVIFPAGAPAAPPDALATAVRAMESYRLVCIEGAALRADILAQSIAFWPASLISREHLLAQMRGLAASIRAIKDPPRPVAPAPAPTSGDAA